MPFRLLWCPVGVFHAHLSDALGRDAGRLRDVCIVVPAAQPVDNPTHASALVYQPARAQACQRFTSAGRDQSQERFFAEQQLERVMGAVAARDVERRPAIGVAEQQLEPRPAHGSEHPRALRLVLEVDRAGG